MAPYFRQGDVVRASLEEPGEHVLLALRDHKMLLCRIDSQTETHYFTSRMSPPQVFAVQKDAVQEVLAVERVGAF